LGSCGAQPGAFDICRGPAVHPGGARRAGRHNRFAIAQRLTAGTAASRRGFATISSNSPNRIRRQRPGDKPPRNAIDWRNYAMNDTTTAPSKTDVNNFDDNDDLNNFMNDMRSQDMRQNSTAADAKTAIDSFGEKTDDGAWPSLDRATVAGRLGEMVAQPRSVQQGGLNLCGPAAFFQMALGRDPVAVANFATALYDSGSATIGSLTVSPGEDLRSADFDAMSQKGANTSQADWMLLGALRNATNPFWQGSWHGDPSQELAGLSRPEELADWMKQSGIWDSVDDHGKWASNPGVPNATELKPYEGTDIALLIHANMFLKSEIVSATTEAKPKLDSNVLMQQFPNHWVVLLNEVVSDVPQQNVTLTVWTWGGIVQLKVPNQVFVDHYFGAVIAKLPSQ
jgi:hypothetical protein